MTKIISIVVNGRKWFDKVNGNTYHSGTVIVTCSDGIKQFEIPYQYGYGDQYVYSAFDVLKREGLIILKDGEVIHAPWQYCRDHNIHLVYDAINVSRKKDC